MLYRDEEVQMVRKIAVLQTSLVFVSLALFVVVLIGGFYLERH